MGILGDKEGKSYFFFAASARRGLLKAHFWQQLQLLWPFWHTDALSDEAWILDSRACSWKNKNKSEDALSERDLGKHQNKQK